MDDVVGAPMGSQVGQQARTRSELAGVCPVIEPEDTDARECVVNGPCSPSSARSTLGEDIDEVALSPQLTGQFVHVVLDASDLGRIAGRHQGNIHAVPRSGMGIRSNSAPIERGANALEFCRAGVAKRPAMSASISASWWSRENARATLRAADIIEFRSDGPD